MINVCIRYTFSLLFLAGNLSAQQSKIDSLLTLMEKDKEDTNKVNHSNNVCLEFIKKKNYNIAVYYGHTSLQLALQLNFKKGLAQAMYNMGEIYYSIADKVTALEYYLKSLNLYEEINDKKNAASVLTLIALNFFMDVDYMRAMDYLMRSLKYYEVLEDKQGIAHTLVNIGWCYMNLSNVELMKMGIKPVDRYSKALQCELKALNIREEINDKTGMAGAMENIGWIYYTLTDSACMKIGIPFTEKDSIALEYEFNGLKILEKNSNKQRDKQIEANILSDIEIIYFKQGQYSNALKYADKTLQLASEIGDISLQRYAQSTFYETYKAMNNAPMALHHYEQYVTLGDSLFKINKQTDVAQAELRFEFDKKEAGMKFEQETKEAVAKEEHQKQIVIRNSFIGGFLLVLILSLVVSSAYRQKQKSNILLAEKNSLIEEQKKIVEKKNKNISDSIVSAQRIQESMLLREVELKNIFPFETFVLFRPRDVVSGDFYWFGKHNDEYLIAAVDCTGHGVPGAFMSVLGNSLLNEIVNERKVGNPAEILHQLDMLVKKTLQQNNLESESHEGMDISICSFNFRKKEICFAGAIHSLYVVRNNELEVIKGDNRSIGGKIYNHSFEKNQSFNNIFLPITEGMSLFLTTDGYTDQFGGDEKIRLGSKTFRKLVLDIFDKEITEQKEALDDFLNKWKGTNQQIDDVLVIGAKIGSLFTD